MDVFKVYILFTVDILFFLFWLTLSYFQGLKNNSAKQNSCCLLRYAQYASPINVISIFLDPGDKIFYTHSGLFVYVSNTTNTFDGTLCYKNDTYTLDTAPADISIPCHMKGQFIMLKSVFPRCVKDPCEVFHCEVSVYGNML